MIQRLLLLLLPLHAAAAWVTIVTEASHKPTRNPSHLGCSDVANWFSHLKETQ